MVYLIRKYSGKSSRWPPPPPSSSPAAPAGTHTVHELSLSLLLIARKTSAIPASPACVAMRMCSTYFAFGAASLCLVAPYVPVSAAASSSFATDKTDRPSPTSQTSSPSVVLQTPRGPSSGVPGDISFPVCFNSQMPTVGVVVVVVVGCRRGWKGRGAGRWEVRMPLLAVEFWIPPHFCCRSCSLGLCSDKQRNSIQH